MDFLSVVIGAMGSSLFVLLSAILFCFIALIIFINLGLFVLWIITLIDSIKRDNKDFAVGGKEAKLIWILLLVFFRQIVPIVYYFLIMYKKNKKPK